MLKLRRSSASHLVAFSRDHGEILAAIVCGVLLFLGWLALNFEGVGLAILILMAAYAIGGYESAREGLTTLFQEKELDVDLLMIVAALGAAGLGLWRQEYFLLVDGAVLILIFAISGALEHYAMQRTERSIRSLMSLTPDTARMLRSGGEEQVAIRRLQIGDVILVKPGELIPTDGVILDGDSTINEAAITGESMPVDKGVGEVVFGGTLNGNGALQIQIHQPPESSLIVRVIRLVEQAQTEKPPSQQFIERFERGYAKVIVVVGVLLALLPPLVWNWSWETTIYRALIFLVVASPCALMAAIMPALLSGIARGAKQGILFKNGAQLELLGRVRAIAFDKTGTLTTGQVQVSEMIPASTASRQDLLQTAASIAAYSEHPIAQAIVRAAQVNKVSLIPATQAQAHVGQGMTGCLKGDSLRLGKRRFALAALTNGKPDLELESQRLEAEGKTVIWVVRLQQVLGLIAVADQIRSDAPRLVKTLKQTGVEAMVMLTGDNPVTAQSVARLIGIERVYAELMPEDKVAVLKRLQQRYETVAMVGDGINDAPALAQASIGIAMGVTGTDVALETADVVLMADRLEKLEQAITIGRRSQRIIRQNIVIALVSVGLLLCANFWGSLTLPAGVLGHEGSTLLVTLNGLRLLKGTV
ncbi:MAG: heavy metal translocating P-type ATPase [Cyanophyceae cyanobacterium]